MLIGIAGAGLCGRLLAWQLLRLGHRVTLLDRDDGDGQQSAGLVAAAMLAPYSEAIHGGDQVLRMGWQASTQWQRLLAALQHDIGIQVALHCSGSLVVAHSADRAELDDAYRRLQRLPGVGLAAPLWLRGTELWALEPELEAFGSGIYLPEEGCLDNRGLFTALRCAIESAGGQWLSRQQVVSVEEGVIATLDSEHHFDYVFDCRGFGGKAELTDFRGVRGEILWLRATEVNLSRPIRLLHPRYQIYVTPKPDHHYVVGATEIESESLAPITVRSALELQSALYTVHSGFAEAEIIEARSQCRPAFVDNLPRIYYSQRMMRLNGLYRHGYLLGPSLVAAALACFNNSCGGASPQQSLIQTIPIESV